jgi:hypothetical protein
MTLVERKQICDMWCPLFFLYFRVQRESTLERCESWLSSTSRKYMITHILIFQHIYWFFQTCGLNNCMEMVWCRIYLSGSKWLFNLPNSWATDCMPPWWWHMCISEKNSSCCNGSSNKLCHVFRFIRFIYHPTGWRNWTTSKKAICLTQIWRHTPCIINSIIVNEIKNCKMPSFTCLLNYKLNLDRG